MKVEVGNITIEKGGTYSAINYPNTGLFAVKEEGIEEALYFTDVNDGIVTYICPITKLKTEQTNEITENLLLKAIAVASGNVTKLNL